MDGIYLIVVKQRDQDTGYPVLNTGAITFEDIPIIGELFVRSGTVSGYNLS